MTLRKYVLDLLKETGMLNYKPTETPIDSNHGLRPELEDVPINKERYKQLAGRLIYLSHTRPTLLMQ